MRRPCRFERYLTAFADGELPEKLNRKVEAHIERCAACASELDSIRASDRILKSHGAPAVSNRLERQVGSVPARAQARAGCRRPGVAAYREYPGGQTRPRSGAEARLRPRGRGRRGSLRDPDRRASRCWAVARRDGRGEQRVHRRQYREPRRGVYADVFLLSGPRDDGDLGVLGRGRGRDSRRGSGGEVARPGAGLRGGT